MKRDWDLVRQLLKDLEEAPANQRASIGHDYDGHDKDTVIEHKYLLIDAGLAEGGAVKSGMSGARFLAVSLEGLTSEGHDFVERIRPPDVWTRVKKTLSEKGGAASVDIVKGLAVAYAKDLVGL